MRKCARLQRRYAALQAKYAARGRRFLGIRVGTGQRRLDRIKAKLDAWCAQAEALDPTATYEAAYQAASAAMPTGELQQALTSVSRNGVPSWILPAALLGLVGIGAAVMLALKPAPAAASVPRAARQR